MLGPDDHAATVDALLVELDVADGAVRALYQELAADPDLAGEYEPRLKELHARRLDLAQRVGLASLARRRAALVPEAIPEVPSVEAAPVETVAARSSPAPVGEVEEDEGPPSAPASHAQIAEWTSTVQSTGLGVGMNSAPSDSTAWPLVLHALMETLGPPRALDTSIGIIEETDALDAVSVPERQTQWARLPRNVQQVWLSVLVARTRALKELPSSSDATKTRVKEIIARYPPWAKTHNPGHVNGMQVKHGPAHGAWVEDAWDDWKTLESLLGEELEPPSSVVPRKKAKRPGSGDVDEPEIEPAWPPLRDRARAPRPSSSEAILESQTANASNGPSSLHRSSGPRLKARARWRPPSSASRRARTGWCSCSNRSCSTSSRTPSSRQRRRRACPGRSSRGTGSRPSSTAWSGSSVGREASPQRRRRTGASGRGNPCDGGGVAPGSRTRRLCRQEGRSRGASARKHPRSAC